MSHHLLLLLVALAGLPGEVTAAPPIAPPPREMTEAPSDLRVKRLRLELLWLDAERKKLEAIPGDNTTELARLKGMEDVLKRLDQIENPPLRPVRMPTLGPSQIPGSRGVPPRPPVRD